MEIPEKTNQSLNKEPWLQGLVLYYMSSLIAVIGVLFGHDFLKASPHPLSQSKDQLAAFANWDGRWYSEIVEEGYGYDPKRHSSTAFFPAYPMLARILVELTDMRSDLALLVVTHLCLATAFALLASYFQMRLSKEEEPWAWEISLLAFALWPTSFFARMAYTESLFLLCIVAALYGLERRWPLWIVAVIAGFATATRSVGVALLLPLAIQAWQTSNDWRHFVRQAWVFPLACWGVGAYMAYQAWAFDDPLTFVRTQENWNIRPKLPLTERMYELLTLQPVWSVFNSNSSCYWAKHTSEINPLFSLHFANPIFWAAAVGLVCLGAWKRWLTPNEISVAAALLLVPYFLRGHEMCMAGMGRFAMVAFPVYLVVGKALAKLPMVVAIGLLGICGFLMGAYSALFAAWYRFF